MTAIWITLSERDLRQDDLPGCSWAGSQALDTRLGYVAFGRRPEAWDAEGPDGVIRRYETICTVMRRSLP